MTQAGKPAQEDHRELDYLLTAYLFDSLSEEGRREVERRLVADPSAQAELEELRATLNLVEESLSGAGDEKPGTYSFEKSRMERVLAASRRRPRFQLPPRRLALALAALLVGLVGLSSIYLLLLGGGAPPGDNVASFARKPASVTRLDEFSETRHGSSAQAAGEEQELNGFRPAASRRREAPGVNDVIGVGGGAAGKYGYRYGKGRLIREPVPEKNKDLKKQIVASGVEFPAEKEAEERAKKQLPEGTLFSRIIDERSSGKITEEMKKIAPQAEKLRESLADGNVKADRDKDREPPGQPKPSAQNFRKRTPEKNRERLKELSGTEASDFEKSGKKAATGVVDPIGSAGVSKGKKRAESEKKWVTRRITQGTGPPSPDDHVVIIAELVDQSAGETGKRAAGGKPARPGGPQEETIFFDDASFSDDSFDEEMLEGNAEEGFVDGDFFSEDEAGGENDGVVSQLAVEGAKSPSAYARLSAPNNANFRLNISRKDGRLIPLGNDAGLESPFQQEEQGQQVQTASGGLQEDASDLAFPHLSQAEDLLMVNEDTLNTFSFYRNLDRRLSFEQFRSRTLAIPPPAIGDQGLGEKGFRKKYGVNPFVATSRDHLSTFGMDVDNASWGRTRETLRAGELPLSEVVRVEEFVNNFTDERAGNPESVFTVFTEGGPSPFGGNELELLQVTIKSRDLLPGERKNAVLTFAVDTSGSMASSGKLELLQESLKTLVSNLGSNDRVAIVAFSTHAYVVLPHTSARQRAHIEAAIDSLSPDGGTNVEAGIDLAYRLAGESHDRNAANRVLLCSDGVANLGAKGPDVILERIRRFAQDNMVSLFTYAFGSGGRQAVQGDKMLQRLANEGDGRYQYVDTRQSARDLFSLPDQLQFLASDAKIQVDFNPEVISHYRLLGYEKRDIADVDFRNDKIDAGEVGPGSTITAIYEIKRSRPIGSLGRIHLRYRDETSRRFEEVDFDLPTGVLSGRIEDTTDRFRFVAAVAEFAEILRLSYYARNGSYGAILQLMSSNCSAWRSRTDWKEAHELITIAQGLAAVEQLKILEDQEQVEN